MMNWNQNDTKYILKRLILYFIIAGIVFFAGHSCAKALTQSEYLFDPTLNYYISIGNGTRTKTHTITNIVGQTYTAFQNYGEGYVVFTFQTTQGNTATSQLKSVEIGNNSDLYTCELGTTLTYNDASAQKTIYTAKCHVNFSNNKGATFILFSRSSNTGDLSIWLSELGTFVSESNGADSIINANNQAIQNQINAGNANAQAIQNAISSSTTNTVNAINNQTTAINNQTQAINDQTDWFDQDYSSIIDTEFLDVFDDLFDNDDDVVRQFILIPLNFFVLIYNACSSNSCSPIELGELYGTTLTIPCINWSSLVGTAVTNTIDIIFAGCLVFGMIRMIKKMINKIMTLSSTITDECGVEVFK